MPADRQTELDALVEKAATDAEVAYADAERVLVKAGVPELLDERDRLAELLDLFADPCEHCNGSGSGAKHAGAEANVGWVECDWCAGLGRVSSLIDHSCEPAVSNIDKEGSADVRTDD